MITSSSTLSVKDCMFINCSSGTTRVSAFDGKSYTFTGSCVLFKGGGYSFDRVCSCDCAGDCFDLISVSVCSITMLNSIGCKLPGQYICNVLQGQMTISHCNSTRAGIFAYSNLEPAKFNCMYSQSNMGINWLFYLAHRSGGESNAHHINFISCKKSFGFWRYVNYCSYCYFVNTAPGFDCYRGGSFQFSNSFSDTFIHQQITVVSDITTLAMSVHPKCLFPTDSFTLNESLGLNPVLLLLCLAILC